MTLAEELGDCRVFGEGRLADTLEYRGRSDLFRTRHFHAGEFEVQDLNSQAVGLICGPQPGETWWDACAGEGGKTLHLSDLMENRGLIWASDRAAWRLAKLKRRAARAGVFNYRAVTWDGGPRLPTKTKFDGVLVDAPCSGIGTWHRNPHARWTTTAEDVKELSEVQQQHAPARGCRGQTGRETGVCRLHSGGFGNSSEWWRDLNEQCSQFERLRGAQSFGARINTGEPALLCGRRNQAATACASPRGSGGLAEGACTERPRLAPRRLHSRSITLSRARCGRGRRLLGRCCLPRLCSVRRSGS